MRLQHFDLCHLLELGFRCPDVGGLNFNAIYLVLKTILKKFGLEHIKPVDYIPCGDDSSNEFLSYLRAFEAVYNQDGKQFLPTLETMGCLKDGVDDLSRRVSLLEEQVEAEISGDKSFLDMMKKGFANPEIRGFLMDHIKDILDEMMGGGLGTLKELGTLKVSYADLSGKYQDLQNEFDTVMNEFGKLGLQVEEVNKLGDKIVITEDIVETLKDHVEKLNGYVYSDWSDAREEMPGKGQPGLLFPKALPQRGFAQGYGSVAFRQSMSKDDAEEQSDSSQASSSEDSDESSAEGVAEKHKDSSHKKAHKKGKRDSSDELTAEGIAKKQRDSSHKKYHKKGKRDSSDELTAEGIAKKQRDSSHKKSHKKGKRDSESSDELTAEGVSKKEKDPSHKKAHKKGKKDKSEVPDESTAGGIAKKEKYFSQEDLDELTSEDSQVSISGSTFSKLTKKARKEKTKKDTDAEGDSASEDDEEDNAQNDYDEEFDAREITSSELESYFPLEEGKTSEKLRVWFVLYVRKELQKLKKKIEKDFTRNLDSVKKQLQDASMINLQLQNNIQMLKADKNSLKETKEKLFNLETSMNELKISLMNVQEKLKTKVDASTMPLVVTHSELNDFAKQIHEMNRQFKASLRHSFKKTFQRFELELNSKVSSSDVESCLKILSHRMMQIEKVFKEINLKIRAIEVEHTGPINIKQYLHCQDGTRIKPVEKLQAHGFSDAHKELSLESAKSAMDDSVPKQILANIQGRLAETFGHGSNEAMHRK